MALNKSTLSEQIYEILRSDILSQKIKLGEKLTLKNLKEQFEVSSTPIREALTRLTEDGLVKYYSNIGVNVIELTEEDLRELYQFMGDLDSLALLYSSKSSQIHALKDKLQEIMSITQDIEKSPLESEENIRQWILYSDYFHLLFYDYCNNSRLRISAEKLRSQLTIFSNMYETNWEIQKKINQGHKEIYNAFLSGNYEDAALLMKQHLENSYEYALVSLKNTLV